MRCCTSEIRLSYILTFTADHVAVALGSVGQDPLLWRWTSRFCGSGPSGCTLGASDASTLVGAVGRLLRRHHALRAGGIERASVASLENLFWLFYDAIERCVDVRVLVGAPDRRRRRAGHVPDRCRPGLLEHRR